MELIEVMEPVFSKEVKEGAEWIHQVKWDGIRGITYIDKENVRIFTKNGRERTDFYPELHETVHLLKGRQAVLDGEIVVLDSESKPSFQKALARERVRTKHNLPGYLQKYPVNYIIFDILFFNNEDLRNLTLLNRFQILHTNIEKSNRIAITDCFLDGSQLLELMKENNFEGIVSKNKNSRYLAGKRHKQWFKTKTLKKILAVVGGLSWKGGIPNSLLLGIYVQDKLYYIGSASGGLSRNDLQLLKEYSSSFIQGKSPFVNISKAKNTTWLKPFLTCWVSFLEWTEGRSLRHPQILGFSREQPDKADGKEFSV